MDNSSFERVYYPRYSDVIEAMARKYAKDLDDVKDDLVSVAMIALLNVDLTRVKANEDAFIRNAMRNRIIDHLRWLNLRRFDRLEAYLERGYDVVRDTVTEEPRLVNLDDDGPRVLGEDYPPHSRRGSSEGDA